MIDDGTAPPVCCLGKRCRCLRVDAPVDSSAPDACGGRAGSVSSSASAGEEGGCGPFTSSRRGWHASGPMPPHTATSCSAEKAVHGLSAGSLAGGRRSKARRAAGPTERPALCRRPVVESALAAAMAEILRANSPTGAGRTGFAPQGPKPPQYGPGVVIRRCCRGRRPRLATARFRPSRCSPPGAPPTTFREWGA